MTADTQRGWGVRTSIPAQVFHRLCSGWQAVSVGRYLKLQRQGHRDVTLDQPRWRNGLWRFEGVKRRPRGDGFTRRKHHCAECYRTNASRYDGSRRRSRSMVDHITPKENAADMPTVNRANSLKITSSADDDSTKPRNAN